MGLLNPNLSTLIATVAALQPILEDVVFVGGTIVGLLVDDPGATSARPTRDVDVITRIAGARGYQAVTRGMLRIGFQPDRSEGAPICRWVKEGLLVDLMGTTDSPFGATNPWYAEGFRTKVALPLPGTDLRIFVIPAPVFLLTKWVAYLDRGQGSMAGSRDIEDILNVLDGRMGLIAEAEQASAAVHGALARMAQQMLASQQFCDYCLESMGDRKGVVRNALERFSGLPPKA